MSENSACRDGLMQSSPSGMPRVAAISGGHLGRRQQPAEARLGALAELDLQRPHRRAGHQVLEPVAGRTGPARRGSRSRRCRSGRPARRRGGGTARAPPSPVLCRQPASAAPRLSASMALPDSEPKLIAGDVDHRLRAGTRRGRPRAAPSTLAHGSRASWPAAGRRRRDRPAERAVLDDRVAGGVLDVVVGAEAEVVVLLLRRGVDPAPLVAGERPLLVVAGHDVLPQLRPDRLEQVAGVPEHREVAQQRVLRCSRSRAATAAAAASGTSRAHFTPAVCSPGGPLKHGGASSSTAQTFRIRRRCCTICAVHSRSARSPSRGRSRMRWSTAARGWRWEGRVRHCRDTQRHRDDEGDRAQVRGGRRGAAARPEPLLGRRRRPGGRGPGARRGLLRHPRPAAGCGPASRCAAARAAATPGWHLKLPVGRDSRDELRVPLGPGPAQAPGRAHALTRVHTRGAEVAPVVRLCTRRRRWLLADDDGRPLAELVEDRVTAHTMRPAAPRPCPGGRSRSSCPSTALSRCWTGSSSGCSKRARTLGRGLQAEPGRSPTGCPSRCRPGGARRGARPARLVLALPARAGRPAAPPTTRWSAGTPRTRCTRCGWPAGGCAAPCRPTGGCWTATPPGR